MVRPDFVDEELALLDDGRADLLVGLALLLPDSNQLPLRLMDALETLEQSLRRSQHENVILDPFGDLQLEAVGLQEQGQEDSARFFDLNLKDANKFGLCGTRGKEGPNAKKSY